MKISKQCVTHLESLKDVEGDFAEFGVFKGSTFILLLEIAKKLDKKLHGFDSFQGMNAPTTEDFDSTGQTSYPKGKLDSKGCVRLIKQLEDLNYEQNEDYFLWEGFIPEIFKQVPKNMIFSFCYIDLDQYKPTIHTLDWVWSKLSVNGIVLCDDYFPHKKILCSIAITKFLKEHQDIEIIDQSNWINYGHTTPTQISFRKISKEI